MVRELSRRSALRGAATTAVLGTGLGTGLGADLGAPAPVAAAQADATPVTQAGRAGTLGNHRLPAPNLSPLLFHSPRVRPFVEELPELPALSGSAIDLAATVGTHSFHPEYGETPTFGYGSASYLGPVIDAHRDDGLTLRFHNRLSQHIFAEDIDTTIHGAAEQDRFAPPSVLHLHGGATPPASDGSPEATILPGTRYTYRYPLHQEAATLWYHDHALGITRLNVYAGLASLFLLRDRWDTGRADNPLGLPAGEFERPLVLQEKIFTSDGAPSMRSTPIVPQGSWEGGATGDVGLVNGKVWPEMTVARGLYRFRVLNGASFSTWRLMQKPP